MEANQEYFLLIKCTEARKQGQIQNFGVSTFTPTVKEGGKKNMKKIAFLMTVAMMIFLGRDHARAALVWDFDLYTLPGPNVGPADAVYVWGTLHNYSTDGETMSFNNMTADYFGGGWNSPAVIPTSGDMVYDFDNKIYSDPLYQHHLYNMTQLISPGQTYTFLISGWTPIPSGAPEGNYSEAHGIYFGNYSVGFDFYHQRTFSWQVSGQVNAVPEPATILLLGLGMMGLAGLRSKMRK